MAGVNTKRSIGWILIAVGILGFLFSIIPSDTGTQNGFEDSIIMFILFSCPFLIPGFILLKTIPSGAKSNSIPKPNNYYGYTNYNVENKDKRMSSRPEALLDNLDIQKLNIPKPFEGFGGYIFVSYKREDLPRIAPIMRNITGWGYNIWYDRGIFGGAEWDAMIEEKVQHCIMLIAFLSKESVESKWVRREIKFADMKNKPILAIRLEDVHLKQGLDVVLSQYQMIKATDADFSMELQRAIDYVRLL